MAQGMNKLNEALAALPEVRELLLSLDAGTSPIAVSGLSGVHRAQLTAAVRHKTQRPLLIVCADENEANRMAGDLHELLGEDVSLLFAREWQLRDRVFASHGWEQQRIGSLCSLAAGKAPILVATVDGLMQRTLPPDALRGAVTDISLGDRFDLNTLSKKLVESGYTRAETVEGVGQFALRGGILDVWSPLSAPVRVEFFDNEVDAMGAFDVTTQRCTENGKSLTVLPAAGVLPALSDGGREKMLERLGRAAQKIAKKAEDSPIVQTLRSDIERLRNDLPLGGMDRRRQPDAAVPSLPHHGDIRRVRDLVDNHPLGRHRPQQQSHGLHLGAAREDIRLPPDRKQRPPRLAGGDLKPLVHQADPLPQFI